MEFDLIDQVDNDTDIYLLCRYLHFFWYLDFTIIYIRISRFLTFFCLDLKEFWKIRQKRRLVKSISIFFWFLLFLKILTQEGQIVRTVF